MHEKVYERRILCKGFPTGKGWEGTGTCRALKGTIGGLSLASPPSQALVTKKSLGNRATECLRSPLPSFPPTGFTPGQLEPEVAFKQLD